MTRIQYLETQVTKFNEACIEHLEGRQLDRAVYRFVFDDSPGPPQMLDEVNWKDGTGYYTEIDPDARTMEIVPWPPEYHESDYLALQVADHIVARFGFEFFELKTSMDFENNRRWYAQFTQIGHTSYYQANDLNRPTAILRAALKAVFHVGRGCR